MSEKKDYLDMTDEEISKGYESENEDEDKWDNVEKACWSGYTQRGMKDKNGRKVPNCVPIEKAEDLSEAGQVEKSIWKGTFLK
jgi:hypothetical protein